MEHRSRGLSIHPRYYYCRTQKGTGTCTGAVVRADDIEEAVLKVLQEKLSGLNIDDLREEYVISRAGERKNYERQKKSFEAELKKIEKSMTNILAAIEEGFRATRMAELGKRKDAILGELRAIDQDAVLDETMERAGLSMLLSDAACLVERVRMEAPEKLRDVLKILIEVEIDPETKNGRIIFPCRFLLRYLWRILVFSIQVGVGRFELPTPSPPC